MTKWAFAFILNKIAMIKPREDFFRIFIFVISVFATQPLYSQIDVERATRETDRLGRQDIEPKLRRPLEEKAVKAKPPEILPEKEEKKFFIKKIKLSGCESFNPKVFSAIIEKYENRDVALTELNNLAKEIEREYLRQGVIAAVFVPPQDIKDGAVSLQVVEAKMGELKIQEHKYFAKERLNYYWKVPPGDILRYDKISKSIQLMNKNPDRQVKAALHAGKKPGTTDVALTPQTTFPAHFTSSYDKEGSSSTGKSRIGLGLRHNNFLGLDDTLLTGYTFGQNFNGIYAYHTLPINYEGASLLYGFTSSKSIPKKEFAAYDLISKAKTSSISIHQDIFDKDEYRGEVYAGFDAKDKTVSLNTGTYNRDRLRVLSFGGNFLQKGMGSSTYISPEFSQGINAFGASSKGNPLASRGAHSTFSKFTLGIQQKRILPLNLQANLKFKTQLASTKLTPQEQFSLGGIDSIRGYPSGDYLADNASLANAELLIPAIFIPKSWQLPYAKESIRQQTTALVFADYGWGERRGALPTEKKSVNFLGIGAGLRTRLYDQALLRLEWGFPLGNNTITEAGKSRFHIALDFQDRLPEEIERIRKLIEEENIKLRAWALVDAELANPQSRLSQELYGYLSLARSSYEEGRLKEAKEAYEKVLAIGRSLYIQSEDYVRSSLLQEKNLRQSHNLALAYYKEEKFQEAKELWEKIVSEAKPKNLILDF